MIIWLGLIILLIIRILINPFDVFVLNFIVLLAYIIIIVGVIGKARWGLFWLWGTSIVSILGFLIFNKGIYITFILDIVLLVLSIIAVFSEKTFNY